MTKEKNLGRREFLKVAIASAAATGLSHFRFLNLAADEIAAPAPLDQCDPIVQSDICIPPNFDPDYQCLPSADACNPQGGDPDLSAPSGPVGDPDQCDPPAGDPNYQCPGPDQDFCDPQAGDPDLCNPGPITAEPDVCLPQDGDPDECDPAFNDPDECLDPPADVCTSLPEPDYPVPTAIEMAAFSAGWTGQGVVVGWETASELDSLGFNLYRSLAARSGYQQINASLIPCQTPGTVQGAAYSYLDSQAQPNTVYYYVIETLDTQGRADRYGPVQANPLRRLLPTRRRPAAGGPDLQSR